MKNKKTFEPPRVLKRVPVELERDLLHASQVHIEVVVDPLDEYYYGREDVDCSDYLIEF